MTHCHTIIETLRQKGYRLTPQREMILETIAHSGNHMTADEIIAQVRMRTQAVNIATVYRTLEMLVDEGLACQTDLGDGKVIYATLQHGPHVHLVCKLCRQVIDADYEMLSPLNEQLLQKFGFSADLQHISIFGVCTQCKKGE